MNGMGPRQGLAVRHLAGVAALFCSQHCSITTAAWVWRAFLYHSLFVGNLCSLFLVASLFATQLLFGNIFATAEKP